MPVTAPENWLNEFSYKLFDTVLTDETEKERRIRFMKDYSKMQRAMYNMRMRSYLKSTLEMAIDVHPILHEFFKHGAVIHTSTDTEVSCLVVHTAEPTVSEICLFLHGQLRYIRFMSLEKYNEQFNARMEAMRKYYPPLVIRKPNPIGFNFPSSPRFKA